MNKYKTISKEEMKKELKNYKLKILNHNFEQENDGLVAYIGQQKTALIDLANERNVLKKENEILKQICNGMYELYLAKIEE